MIVSADLGEATQYPGDGAFFQIPSADLHNGAIQRLRRGDTGKGSAAAGF
jgi:hypothetical protein